jgi:hypothetical protein
MERYLLKICFNSKMLTYYENKYLYSLEVLEHPNIFMNDNISGTIFTKDLIK